MSIDRQRPTRLVVSLARGVATHIDRHNHCQCYYLLLRRHAIRMQAPSRTSHPHNTVLVRTVKRNKKQFETRPHRVRTIAYHYRRAKDFPDAYARAQTPFSTRRIHPHLSQQQHNDCRLRANKANLKRQASSPTTDTCIRRDNRYPSCRRPFYYFRQAIRRRFPDRHRLPSPRACLSRSMPSAFTVRVLF